MSGPDAAAVASHAAGALDAHRVVFALRTNDPAPGLLQAALEAVLEHNEPERTAAFIRQLEKALARPWGPMS